MTPLIPDDDQLSPLALWVRTVLVYAGYNDPFHWGLSLGVTEKQIDLWSRGITYPTPRDLRAMWLICTYHPEAFKAALALWEEIKDKPLSVTVPKLMPYHVGGHRHEKSLAELVLVPVYDEFDLTLRSLPASVQEQVLKSAYTHAVREQLRTNGFKEEITKDTTPLDMLLLQGFEPASKVTELVYDKPTDQPTVMEHKDYLYVVIEHENVVGDFRVTDMRPYRVDDPKHGITYGWVDSDGNLVNNKHQGDQPHDRECVTHFMRRTLA